MTLFQVLPAESQGGAAPATRVLHVEESPLAPAPQLVAGYTLGELDGDGFARAYVTQLLRLYQTNPAALEAPLSAASPGGLLLVADAWDDEWYAPRRVLAGLLHHVSRSRSAAGAASLRVRADGVGSCATAR